MGREAAGIGNKGNKRWWNRRSRRIKPHFLICAVVICILLAIIFPHGFIMLMIGALLALLGLYFLCNWR